MSDVVEKSVLCVCMFQRVVCTQNDGDGVGVLYTGILLWGEERSFKLHWFITLVESSVRK